MPYKNIVYTKLRCELLADERFTDKLDDEGKLMFFCLLLMAGVKENRIPDDEKYLKRVLNLQISEQKIREKLTEVFNAFPKTVSIDGVIKFKNYNKLHNPLGKPEGTPKDTQRRDLIYNIIKEYIRIKRYNIDNDPFILNQLIKRNCKAAKELLILSKANLENVVRCMGWFNDICEKKDFSWSLETICKWYPEWVKDKDYKPSALERFEVKKG